MEKMMKLGIERIDEYKDIFIGKKVGLITNPTGIDKALKSTIDILLEKVNLVALFSPEHGIRGNIEGGDLFGDYLDEKTGIKVFSLYNEEKRPTKEALNGLDIICIDIQDVGSRFYTYIYTMAYAMMACKDSKKKFVVFDRPNPMNAINYEGNIVDMTYRSFIGYYPILQRHGMTIGELAWLFNEEYEIGCDLTVICMKDYTRDMQFEETGCTWILPSPNIPKPTTSLFYNSTCVFEGTNISEGRGTTIPFEVIGAPFIDPFVLAQKMNDLNLKDVYFRPMYFTPLFSKHEKKVCGGVQIHILNKKTFTPIKIGWALLDVVRTMYPNEFLIREPYVVGGPCMLELNTGCEYIKTQKYTLLEQFKIIDQDSEKFGLIRSKYLLY
jgi:uncharacterized protein YbbC (DUF1343 family)